MPQKEQQKRKSYTHEGQSGDLLKSGRGVIAHLRDHVTREAEAVTADRHILDIVEALHGDKRSAGKSRHKNTGQGVTRSTVKACDRVKDFQGLKTPAGALCKYPKKL